MEVKAYTFFKNLIFANSLVFPLKEFFRNGSFWNEMFLNMYAYQFLSSQRDQRGENGFQAITICPSTPQKELKVKALKYTGLFIIVSWNLHMLMNFIFPIYITGTRESKSSQRKRIWGSILVKL